MPISPYFSTFGMYLLEHLLYPLPLALNFQDSIEIVKALSEFSLTNDHSNNKVSNLEKTV